MAKGQKRSNREAKKPKVTKAPAQSPVMALFKQGSTVPITPQKKKGGTQ
jgi:hypothetical protein